MNLTPKRRKILYVGDLAPGTTCGHRMQALIRLGQDVEGFAPSSHFSKSSLLSKIRYRLPLGPLVAAANSELMRAAKNFEPEIVWLDKPLVFTPETIQAIKSTGARTVCINLDNPFGPRKDGCWLQFKRIYRMMDLHALVREVDVPRYSKWGLPFVKIMLSYEPTEHFPPPENWNEADRPRDVSFTGSPYDDRPRFLRTLAETYHLPVVIAGGRWHRLPDAELYKKYVTHSMLLGSAYREMIWKSKINLAFITKSNEEDVAHKSFEIAACASFLLAERSAGHLAAFEEGKEAEFFSSVEECAEKCRYYLDHPEERQAIALRGRERAVRSGYDNDSQLRKVLLKLDGVDA